MLKRIFSFLLLLSFTFYILSSPIVWAAYYIYKDYIFENYCENKDIPSCCGKCHITKIDNEQPKNSLPKIEVRNPEIASFVLSKIDYDQLNKYSLLFIGFLERKDISLGFIQDLLIPPELSFLS